MSSTIKGRNPLPVGDRWMVVVDHIGPSSYTQVTSGATPSGGDSITAVECGLKFIQCIHSSIDDSGSYMPVPLAIIGDQTTAILDWLIKSGATEVGSTVNLSARHATLIVWGR